MKEHDKRKLNEAYQDVLRKIVIWGVLSMLLLASSKITGWIIMEFAGLISVVYTIILVGILFYIAFIKRR
ncbi:hypothetical protein M5C72_08395 [Companilactobacillus allii]|uniref:Uncharacterized protein n=1 Tax=Companilactobacillus allii TaxID=1847728 RepID=A0A1P8Q5H3_9LACO|nr:hypothetical protein [Companilactobacillus allii]APX73100.1 hypothetical protein BTM29_11300 [Companilactobacillus allii]USQ67901.1 hypothetical protein M5C72_08395 [Companilactobacillus allii]